MMITRLFVLLAVLLLATSCAAKQPQAPQVLSSGPTSTDVIAALTAPLTAATQVSMQLAPQMKLTATRDPAGAINIENTIPPDRAASVFIDQPLGSIVIQNGRALWREPLVLESHSLPKDSWIDVPLTALTLDRGHQDTWSSAARLVVDVLLADVELSTLLLVEIEDVGITETPLTTPAKVREEFHFSNDTHDVAVTLDQAQRLSKVVVETASSSTVFTASYEAQPAVPTPQNVLNPAVAAPVVDAITAPARLENLTMAALRFDALIRSLAPGSSSRSITSLKTTLLAQDVLGSATLELASSNGAVTVWSNNRLDEAALDTATPDPTFIQLRQRDITVCLRLSADGDTFTFLSPAEDLSSPRPGELTESALSRDPDGSVITATSTSKAPACSSVTPRDGNARW